MANSSGSGNPPDPAPFRLTLLQSSCLTNVDVRKSSLVLGFCFYGQHLVAIMFRFSDVVPTPSALDFQNLKVITTYRRQGHASDMPGLQIRWPPISMNLPFDDLKLYDSAIGCDLPLPWMASLFKWCLVTPVAIC